MDQCINCNSKPILVKKFGLCQKCYQDHRRKGILAGLKKINYPSSPRTQQLILIDREFEFVRNFFKHDNWIRHPVNFYLDEKGEKYTPDFYDGNRNVFIEVAGTRQAWDQRKPKLKLAIERFPKIKFEARMVSGEEISLDGRVDWNGSDAL